MRNRLLDIPVVLFIVFLVPLHLVDATNVLRISSPWGSRDEYERSYELEFHRSGLLRSIGVTGEPPDALVLYHGLDAQAEQAFLDAAQQSLHTRWLFRVSPDYRSFAIWQNRFPDGSIDGSDHQLIVEQRESGRLTLVEEGNSTWQLIASSGSISFRLDGQSYHQDYALRKDDDNTFTIITDLGGNMWEREVWQEEDSFLFHAGRDDNLYTFSGAKWLAGTERPDLVRAMVTFLAVDLAIDWYAAAVVAFLPLVRD